MLQTSLEARALKLFSWKTHNSISIAKTLRGGRTRDANYIIRVFQNRSEGTSVGGFANEFIPSPL